MIFKKRLLPILLSAVLVLTVFCGFGLSAGAVPAEVKGITIADCLGMDGVEYLSWLMSHENDGYYLGTPYVGYDHRNPNGDCSKANGDLDKKGVAAMNCTGFVWHALYKPTLASGGKTNLIPALGRTGWYSFYSSSKISRRYFSSKKAMLDSGYLEKGDLIWMFVNGQETVPNDYHHVGIYWGDGSSDVMWHSSERFGKNAVTAVCPEKDNNVLYVALKAGGRPAGEADGLEAPEVTKIEASASGIKLCWNKVEGAYKYRVFRKNNGSWKKLGDTLNTSWTNKAVVFGGEYTYTVRCISRDGSRYISSYNKNGYTLRYLPTPSEAKFAGTDNGTKISWSLPEGAEGCRVFYKSGTKWKKLADVCAPESTYTDTTVQSAKSRVYTLRLISYDGSYTSYYYTAGFTAVYNAPPKLLSAVKSSQGILIKWSSTGAAKYRLFKKADTGWKKVADTKNLNYTVKNASMDDVFTVRCLSPDGKYYSSGYDKNGISAR